jgi:hypothetical protein
VLVAATERAEGVEDVGLEPDVGVGVAVAGRARVGQAREGPVGALGEQPSRERGRALDVDPLQELLAEPRHGDGLDPRGPRDEVDVHVDAVLVWVSMNSAMAASFRRWADHVSAADPTQPGHV